MALPYSDTTFGGQIERCYRRLLANQREQIVQPTGNVLIGDASITFAGPGADGIQPGSIIALDQEKLLVSSATPNNNNFNWAVIRGFQDSTPAAHTASSIGIVDPKFDRNDIGTAICDALNYLSSPVHGLFRPVTQNITYNPVARGYDMGAFPVNFGDLLEITYDLPDASHNFPTIKREHCKVRRGISNTKIPSGVALILDEGAYPGLNMNITVEGPFTLPVNLTDDLVTLCGLPYTAIHIPAVCAEADLIVAREVKRDFIEEQPDPKRAVDVPVGAMSQAALSLLNWRDRQIAVEAARLRKIWPRY